jgi:hypothetical protein
MIPPKEIVHPGRGLVQHPVAGRGVAFFQGFFFAGWSKPAIGADEDALLLAREDLAPPFR